MKRPTLSSKALFAVLLILLPVFAASYYGYIENRDYLKQNILQEMIVTAEAYEGQIYLFLEMSKRRAQDFSSDGFIRNRLEEIINGKVASVSILNEYLYINKLPLDKNISGIHIIDLNGRVAASTNKMAIGIDMSKEVFFMQGKKTSTISEYYTSISGLPELAIANPILSRKTYEPIGVIVNFVPLSELNKLMTGEFNRDFGALSWSKGGHKTMESYLVNKDGLMLTKSIFIPDSVLRQKVDTVPVRECMNNNIETASFYNDYRGTEVAGASMCIPSMRWTLLVETDYEEVIAPLNVMQKVAITTGIIITGLIIVLFMIFMKGVIIPLGILSRATEKIAQGNYDISIPVNTFDEIGILSTQFNMMAHEIKSRTDEVEKEKLRLHKSEEKFRTIFENTKDAIFVTAPYGNVLELNPAGADILGYSSPEDFRKLNIYTDIFYDPLQRDNFINELEKKGFIKDTELTLRKSNGQLISAIVSASVNRDEHGNITAYQGIIHDMTEYNKLEQQLFQAQKMEAIGQLTGGIAHDFNNILTAIMGNASMLSMKIDKFSPHMQFVNQIMSSVDRAARLTQGLLTFSRKQHVEKKNISLHNTIQTVDRILRRLIGEDIEMILQLNESDITINADAGQIEQILMNLATNARDAMPGGGILRIETGVTEIDETFRKAHGYGKPGAYGVISVTDTGEGMDSQVMEKMFDPFFTTKEVGKGTGLGLSIIYGIVKQHDGYISAYSEPGKGTRFNIYVPATESCIADEHKDESLQLVSGSGIVLLAEDEPEVRQITKDILENAGYTVIEAVDGEDAINKFSDNKNKIDLLVLDVIMPRRNGKEVFDFVKTIRKDIKVIFTSGYDRDLLLRKGVFEEGVIFTNKPLKPVELLRQIQEMMK